MKKGNKTPTLQYHRNASGAEKYYKVVLSQQHGVLLESLAVIKGAIYFMEPY